MSDGTSDDGITRRSALGAAAVAVVGGVGGYLVARNSDAAKAADGTVAANAYGDPPRAAGKALATVADIPDGGGLILSKPAVVVTRSGAQVHAFSSVCTHEGCRVDKVTNGRIDCPVPRQRVRRGDGQGAGRPGALAAAAHRGHGAGRPGVLGMNRVLAALPTILWLLAAGFAVGVLIALR